MIASAVAIATILISCLVVLSTVTEFLILTVVGAFNECCLEYVPGSSLRCDWM